MYLTPAEKKLTTLPETDFIKIRKALNSLSDDPCPPGHLKLEGTKETLYRIRIGHYLVVYSIEQNIITITILNIGHRKDVYRS